MPESFGWCSHNLTEFLYLKVFRAMFHWCAHREPISGNVAVLSSGSVSYEILIQESPCNYSILKLRISHHRKRSFACVEFQGLSCNQYSGVLWGSFKSKFAGKDRPSRGQNVSERFL